METIHLRTGTVADLDHVMHLMDDAVAWLVAQDRPGQWGTEPLSSRQASVDRMRSEVESNDLWLAEIDGKVVGAMLLGDKPMEYVEAVDEPELYLHLLVTHSNHRGAGIGRVLVAKAKEVALKRGINLIRVDCYAGDDRKLVAAYERLGFTQAQPFAVKEWPGQVLELRLGEI